ncbi:MAG TPA: CHAT domain-containing tetratricopeptide repeat protein [Acidimicrobiales bacterium]|nr:CHAT domain-containing tetratricopeptide repeat protein [Acidimicrobiales bacterium]
MAAVPDEALARALEAVSTAWTSPAQAGRLATEVLAGSGADPEARSVAARALGLAATACGDPVAAARHLRRAARLAERAGLPERVVEARAGLVNALASAGQMQAALAEADRAVGLARGRPAAVLAYNRAVVLWRLGRLDESVEWCNRALATFVRVGDGTAQARVLSDRGVARAYQGRWSAALADLERAEAIHRAGGHRLAAAQVLHNKGFVLALQGDVPGALARYDEAAAEFEHVGGDAAVLHLDRAEVLLSVRLVEEAGAAADRAVADYRRRRMAANVAEARLVVARAALARREPAAASRAATQARRAFLRQGRPGWAALAGSVALQAAWATGRRGPAELARARCVAAELAERGLAGPALDARILAARLALELGQRDAAAAELALAARARRRGPAELRVHAWYAEALRRLADGDRRGATTALRAGIGVVDRFRSTLGATELRAGASGHGVELAALGLRLAVEDDRPDQVLAWSERCRAATVLLRPARPPRPSAGARQEAELRRVARDLDAAALAGHPTGHLLRRQRDLEQALRSRARHAGGGWAPPPALVRPSRALSGALGADRALVEYVGLDGGLRAVVVRRGGATLHRLGEEAAVRARLGDLRFALRRLAHGLDAGGAATRSAAAAAAELDELLVAPLADRLGGGEVVVVPTGVLASLPWSALPSLGGRTVSVAPSAAMWLRASRARKTAAGPPSPVVLAAGPGLPAAAAEVTGLARSYPGAVRLTGRRATAPAVIAALDGAGLAHVAAHGSFRSDNPLFSCLHLADGPLTVYDLEGLRQAPDVVVLSACDSALADVGPGDELIGLAAALFALGTAALVATVVPVPDAATRRFMSRFHRHLRTGLGPAPALAAARADARPDPALAVAAAGFVCLGAG